MLRANEAGHTLGNIQIMSTHRKMDRRKTNLRPRAKPPLRKNGPLKKRAAYQQFARNAHMKGRHLRVDGEIEDQSSWLVRSMTSSWMDSGRRVK